MNPKEVCCFGLLGAVLALAAASSALADDSAASIAAGGLVPRRETRIVMAKEALRISDKKVVVDYDFRNDTNQDVTTEVAFPIPPYENDWVQQSLAGVSFSDFRLHVDGKQVLFHSEAKATLKGKDISAILAADKIDVASFGHFEELPGGRLLTRDIERLPVGEQKRLVALGVLDTDPPVPNWTVHLQYHWTQTFPAHSTVHIRHEYSPTEGFEMMPIQTLEWGLVPADTRAAAKLESYRRDDLNLLMSVCPEPEFLNGMVRRLNAGSEDETRTYTHWVDFILTSANTWQRPIEDFTLIIERGKPEQGGKRLISFCSPGNGKVEKLDSDRFQVHLTNFVPTSELRIGFFDVPLPKPAQPSAAK
jgi:hypothetical protein